MSSGGAATTGVGEATSKPTIDSTRSRQQELTQRRHRVEQELSARSNADAHGVEVTALRMELEFLKYYELICAQLLEELDRSTECQEELKQAQSNLQELRLSGPEEPAPYSVLVWDDLQDQLESQHTRLQTLGVELASAKDVLQSTLQLREEAEAKRRQTREKLERERDASARQRVARQLELDQLKCQLFADMTQLRRTEIGNRELERQIAETSSTYLQEKIAVVATKTVFTDDQLQAILAELDRFEADLRGQLPVLQSRLQELEAKAFDAHKEQASESVLDKQQQAERKTGWAFYKRNCQLQVKMVQQRLRDVVLARVQWNMRYTVFNGQATREQLVKWADDSQQYLERMRASRVALEDESKSLMVDLGRKEKQVRILRQTNPPAAKWVEYQIAGMHELSQAYANNLVQIETLEKMLTRLADMLQQDARPEDAADWLGLLGGHLRAAWNFEITSVDDRPITVRKIVAGIFLMFLGVYLSRRLSRLIGRRMLPRIGFDSGASTAVQSIAFYLLISCFAVVALELINIPITVFTFLGGAVAIGVGFGSQNILNNFISGLILLAEQPIRVGDLVEIGDMCGNVEKIGARSTRIKTGSNLEIIVPNSKLLEDNVTNWTLSDTRMRTVVRIGVAYGSPTLETARILQLAISECPQVLKEPEPIVLFSDFGDNALMFEVHFWLYVRTMMQARRIESEVRHTIDRLMREASITIAFPQRDVHLDTIKPIEVNIRSLAEDDRFSVRRQNAA